MLTYFPGQSLCFVDVDTAVSVEIYLCDFCEFSASADNVKELIKIRKCSIYWKVNTELSDESSVCLYV